MPSTLTPEEMVHVRAMLSLKRLAESMTLPAGLSGGFRVAWADGGAERVWGVFSRGNADRMVRALVDHFLGACPGGAVAANHDLTRVVLSHPRWPGDDTVVTIAPFSA